MCSDLRRTVPIALLLLLGVRPADAETSSSRQLQEGIWPLPFDLPTLPYVVHPAGKGPSPLAVMNHGVSLNTKERSFFPLVEFRGAAFWLARRGYMVVAPAGPGYGGGGFDSPERGIFGPFFSHVGPCEKPNFRGAGLAIALLDGRIIDYMITQKVVQPDKVVVVGQPAGGWGAIALSSQMESGRKLTLEVVDSNLQTIATSVSLNKFAAAHKGGPSETCELPDDEQ